MPKISYAGCLGLSPAILAQFTFKMCVAAQNGDKFILNPYSGSSRLFKVIDFGANQKRVCDFLY